MTVRVHLLVKGLVQGVGFRFFARGAGRRLGVIGWVRNLYSGEVEAEAEGDRDTVQRFVEELKTGHPFARVDSITEKDIPLKGERDPFDIY